MAKCIKYSSGVISRYDDDTAYRIVSSGAAHFTTKCAWKAYAAGARESFARLDALKRLVERRDTAAPKDWAKADRRRKQREAKRKERFDFQYKRVA